MFGGNSNWRGPVWFPVNYLVVNALLRYARYFGDDVTLEYPSGSGRQLTLGEIGEDIRRRLISLFLVGEDGRRPCFGGVERMQSDPAWKDNILFNEYFHGDNGAGLGASHQTGWTGIVADMIRRSGGADIPSLADLMTGLDDGTDPAPDAQLRGLNACSSSCPCWTTPQLDSGTSFHAPARSPSGSETTSRVSSESSCSNGLSGY